MAYFFIQHLRKKTFSSSFTRIKMNTHIIRGHWIHRRPFRLKKSFLPGRPRGTGHGEGSQHRSDENGDQNVSCGAERAEEFVPFGHHPRTSICW